VQPLILLGTAFLLGTLHALEVDHMLAVSAFVSRRPALRAAAGFGLRWGVGHSTAVFVAGGLLLLSGFHWPAHWDAVGEGVVGLLLVGLGAWALRSASKLHLHPAEEHGDHAHLHVHGHPAESHAHDHPASNPHPHGHDGRRGVGIVGLLHGLAGTSAVVALVPVTLMASRLFGLAYLLAFGLGTMLGMTGFAFAAAVAMRSVGDRSIVWGRRMAMGVGLAGVVVGVWWVLRAAGMTA
jgi:ABC-type nickel/cobalt efflux system permease component RcnA